MAADLYGMEGMSGGRRKTGVAATARGSIGGRANEAGSLFRSGVAAYLAAHGLAGRGLEAAGYPERGPAPVALSFETGEAVDDIKCDLADGTSLRLQAKRSCGADAQLAATVAQWAGQAGALRDGDKIGLVTAEPTGPVRDLGAALDRRRHAAAGPVPPKQTIAIRAVLKVLPEGTSQEIVEEILAAALVMVVTVSTARDEGFRSVANLLDGTVVPPGSGSAAVSALQHAFQIQAATGTGSSIDGWLAILAKAGLEVYPDAAGPAGPRRRAELDAVTAFRAALAKEAGILRYSLLA